MATVNPEKNILNMVTETAIEPATILQRIAAGDSLAVEDCLQRYGGLVWSLSRRWLSNSADAEDASQEIFVEIWKKAKSFDPSKSSEAAFVTLITRRRLIDRLRRTSSTANTLNMSAIEYDVPEEVTVQPAELAAELADEADKALRCIERLSSQQKQVIELSIHHGCSHTHIAERLSMPLGTVKSFARRALLQLKDCMAKSAVVTAEGGTL
ncbi:ECF RNA polymerase sigma factor SigK [Rubripirellula obstinata]|uniref:ECF RNA polymerase sigma factor SigK n=1 Tax=Rubripirellula obstinata TaxID=406547 RepID=A0A5B1CKS7_9BACT|nr:sigma-70 family RNA polymerase sigma factor [Rubripirellula obstinata]KAA1261807.1 ECF RNA polymerase sigma factor SigK [Rubripirellula obstinata]